MKASTKILSEKKIFKDASDLVWINGTTKKRFNIQTKHFNLPIGIYDPLFLIDDMRYAREYSLSHAATDYGDRDPKTGALKSNRHSPEVVSAIRGGNTIVVFMVLKPGIEFFDFTDPWCFEEIGLDRNFQKIFADCEPYFAFNSKVRPNSKLSLRPIEFIIAMKYLIYTSQKREWSKKETKDDKFEFENLVFLDTLNSIDVSHYRIKNVKQYQIFAEEYNKAIAGGNISNLQQQSGYYGNVVWKNKLTGNNVAVLPSVISLDQLQKVNLYFKLFNVYKSVLDKIPAEVKKNIETAQKTSANNATSSWYVDLMQAVLHFLIAKRFKGYYCPETKGSKSFNLRNVANAIAIFDDSIIDYSNVEYYDTIQIASASNKEKIVDIIKDVRDAKARQEVEAAELAKQKAANAKIDAILQQIKQAILKSKNIDQKYSDSFHLANLKKNVNSSEQQLRNILDLIEGRQQSFFAQAQKIQLARFNGSFSQTSSLIPNSGTYIIARDQKQAEQKYRSTLIKNGIDVRNNVDIKIWPRPAEQVIVKFFS